MRSSQENFGRNVWLWDASFGERMVCTCFFLRPQPSSTDIQNTAICKGMCKHCTGLLRIQPKFMTNYFVQGICAESSLIDPSYSPQHTPAQTLALAFWAKLGLFFVVWKTVRNEIDTTKNRPSELPEFAPECRGPPDEWAIIVRKCKRWKSVGIINVTEKSYSNQHTIVLWWQKSVHEAHRICEFPRLPPIRCRRSMLRQYAGSPPAK